MVVQNSSPRKRINFRIQLSAEAHQDVGNVCERFGISRRTLTSRVIRWFVKQHAVVHSFVLGLVPKDLEQAIAKMALNVID